MIFLCLVLFLHRFSASFGQYLSIPGLLGDDGLLPQGRPTYRSDLLQADLALGAGLGGLGLGAGLSIRAGLPPTESGCKPACPRGQRCVQNSCACFKGFIISNGLCGPKLLPLIQSIPGGPCGHGEECTGGSTCQDGVCCCPPYLVQMDEVCILPPPPPPPPVPLLPLLPGLPLPSLSVEIGRNLLGILKKK